MTKMVLFWHNLLANALIIILVSNSNFVLSGDDGDILPAAPPLEILDTVAGYEILSFDSGELITGYL